jgi:glycosyltransferase involved in cell wall biosynthesis
MLWDKGIGEFVEAARVLKRKGCPARFVLVGRRDGHNPAAIPAPKLNGWVTEEAVEWWGHRDDMPDVYRAAVVVVLPSYREGLPKVLLEAAACGKAIVTTDVPGCRDVVRSHDNGLLVPAKNSQALAEAIEQLLEDPDRRATMGARAREIAEKEWATPVITEQVLNLYRELWGGFGLPRVDEAM